MIPEPLRRPEFITGLVFGLAALLVALGTILGWRKIADAAPIPVSGLLFAASAGLGLRQAAELPRGLVLGLVGLAGGGLAAELLWRHRHVQMALAVPGAWLVAFGSELVAVPWVRVLVLAAIVVGGSLVADFDDRWRPFSIGSLLFPVSVVGIYLTVAETDQALVLLGSALPLVALGFPRPLASLGTGGSYAATGLLVWTAAAGGIDPLISIIGGVACLGLLIAEPLSRALNLRQRSLVALVRGRRGTVAVFLIIQIVLIYVAARVAGASPSAAGAALTALIVIGAGVGVCTALSAPSLQKGVSPSEGTFGEARSNRGP